jgi:hypothetical protein
MEYSEIINLLQLLLIFLAGAYCGTRYTLYRLQKALEEAGVDFEEKEKIEVIQVKKYFIEKINELLYLYEHNSNQFIGQGKSLEELAVIAKDKTEIAGVSYNEEIVWFVDGKVKTTL